MISAEMFHCPSEDKKKLYTSKYKPIASVVILRRSKLFRSLSLPLERTRTSPVTAS